MCHALVFYSRTSTNKTWHGHPTNARSTEKHEQEYGGTLHNPCASVCSQSMASGPCPQCLLPPLPTDQIANIQKNTDHLSLSILEKIQYERTTSYCFEYLNMQSIILSNDRAQEATQASQKAYQENKEKAPELKGHKSRGRTTTTGPSRGCHRPPLQHLQSRPPPRARARQPDRDMRWRCLRMASHAWMCSKYNYQQGSV